MIPAGHRCRRTKGVGPLCLIKCRMRSVRLPGKDHLMVFVLTQIEPTGTDRCVNTQPLGFPVSDVDQAWPDYSTPETVTLLSRQGGVAFVQTNPFPPTTFCFHLQTDLYAAGKPIDGSCRNLDLICLILGGNRKLQRLRTRLFFRRWFGFLLSPRYAISP
jgi:hypothetical protein